MARPHPCGTGIQPVNGLFPQPARQRHNESGYALLLVFLLAAAVAISLYSEIPRVAFQSQRHKEQLLMERGLQYMRAIQVFQQVNKGQWPRNLDDLETSQTRHFLRHRYIDPMTGKDDWRLLHVQGNMLTDSLVTQNPAASKDSASSQSSYVSAYAGVGQTLTPDQPQRQAGPARRPSEGAGGDLPPLSLGGMPGGSDQSGQSPAPGATPDNPANSAANTPAPGVPGATGPTGSMTPGQNPTGMPGLPGQTGNPALNMINNILTNPNPAAAQMAAQGGFGSTPMGGGLAGVASKSEDEGIMEYNKQTLYKKWEFVFDPTKVAPLGGSGGAPGTSINQIAQQQQGQAGGASGGMMGGIQQMQQSGAGGPQGNTSAFGSPGSPSSMQPGGTSNSPASAQGGGGTGAMPPGFRMGRP